MIQDKNEIGRAKSEIKSIISGEPQSILDTTLLSQQLGISEDSILDSLIELQKVKLVQPIFFWECTNGFGTSREAFDIREFPEHIRCDRCGEVHWFSQDQIEVHFVPDTHSDPIYTEEGSGISS